MQFVDYSPPASPSLDQQRDALQKGLGRTLHWASSGHLADAPLLEACVHDKVHDLQCEGSRGNWLWNIVRAAGAKERFRDPLFKALNELSDERSAIQLCELALHYAEAGDERFRFRLYEIVAKKPISDSPCLGEEQIIKLDGLQAFLFAARVRGERLATIEWDWDDASLAHDVVERFGEERIVNLLASSTDSHIKRFHEKWKEQTKRKPTRYGPTVHRDRTRAIAVNEIVEAAKGDNNCYWFRGWGMHADETDLNTVLAAVWDADAPNVLCRLLKVFSNRALPKFDSRLIDLCRHGDDDVQRWAFTALAKNSNDAIHKFALKELEVEATGPVVRLFVENFEIGDEEKILTAMNLPEDACHLHWLLMDVIKVMENNRDADCSQLGVITYGSTPCENCRSDAARLLHRQGVVPSWILEECRYDSNEECRELAEDFAGPKQTDSKPL